jgi:4-hydroxy-tetrahydrodipicolinate synthase
MAIDLHGIIPPVITPFGEDENFSPGALRDILDYLVDQGVHAIFVIGSVGEFFALRMEETKEVIRTAVRAVDGRVPVLTGTGAIATRDAIELSRYAEGVGADALSVLTPFFIHPNQEELYQHYAAIARAVKVPVLGYTNPGRSGGITLPPPLMNRLASDFDNVIGIKDSSGSLPTLLDYQRLCPPHFKIFTGLDTLIFDAVINNCAGAVAGLANFVPALAVSVYELTRAGRLEEAKAAQRRLLPLREAYGLGSFPSVVKEAMSMLGLPAGRCRRPTQPLSPEARLRLRQALVDALGEDALGE